MWKNPGKKRQGLVWGKRSEGTMCRVLGVLAGCFATVCEHPVVVAPALKDALGIGLVVTMTSQTHSTLRSTRLGSGCVNMSKV